MMMFRRVLDKRALERLELNAGKLARSVLRGWGSGNTVSLPATKRYAQRVITRKIKKRR